MWEWKKKQKTKKKICFAFIFLNSLVFCVLFSFIFFILFQIPLICRSSFQFSWSFSSLSSFSHFIFRSTFIFSLLCVSLQKYTKIGNEGLTTWYYLNLFTSKCGNKRLLSHTISVSRLVYSHIILLLLSSQIQIQQRGAPMFFFHSIFHCLDSYLSSYMLSSVCRRIHYIFFIIFLSSFFFVWLSLQTRLAAHQCDIGTNRSNKTHP